MSEKESYSDIEPGFYMIEVCNIGCVVYISGELISIATCPDTFRFEERTKKKQQQQQQPHQ